MSVTLKSGEKIAALKQGIEGVTGETYADLTEAVNGLKEERFEAGIQSDRETFWKVFLNEGKGRNFRYAFAYDRFTDENFHPTYDIVGNTNSSALTGPFVSCDITEIPVAIVANSKNLSEMFRLADSLRRIHKIVFNQSPSDVGDMFSGTTALEEVTFEGMPIGINGLNLQDCTKLNHDSIESAINILSSTTSGLTVTFSKTAKEAAFTEEEWAELVATKPNWTISLA